MRPLAFLALLAALAGARPAVEPVFRVRVVEYPICPPRFDVELSAEMPDAGWSLVVDRISDPDESGRRIVEITATPGEGAFAQVVTPSTAKLSLGTMRRGVYLLDVHFRRGAAKYQRVQAVVLRGGGLGEG